MKVYASENNIEKLVKTNITANLVTAVKLEDDKPDLLVASLEKGKKEGFSEKVSKAIAKLSDKDLHPDLMYGSAILVSTVINENDDVFLPEETWKARNSPVNTPYNDEHIQSDIIGHIIASRTLDKDGKEISSEEPPDYFDIEVDFVVYQSIFPGIAKDIYENAPKAKKFVSMEAIFSDFDYALLSIDDAKANLANVKVIARNEETAFLTKYLKAYGGDGEYKQYRIGRVLKDFRFVGMGNVGEPANPASKYTKIENYELAESIKFMEESNSQLILLVKGNKMTQIKTLEDALAHIEELQKKVQEFEQEKSKSAETDLTSKLEEANTKVEVAKQALETANNKINELNTNIETIQKELKTKNDELDGIKVQSKTVERVAKLETLGFKVTDEKREEVTKMSDETFSSLEKWIGELPKPTKKEDDTNSSDPKNVNNAKNQANKTLDGAKPNKGTDVTDGEGNAQTSEEKIKSAADNLAAAVIKYRKKNHKSKKDE